MSDSGCCSDQLKKRRKFNTPLLLDSAYKNYSGTRFPWASSAINCDVVRDRLKQTADLFTYNVSISRRWMSFLEDDDYRQWHDLKPTRCYLVAAVHDDWIEANVLRFVETVPVSDERSKAVDAYIAYRLPMMKSDLEIMEDETDEDEYDYDDGHLGHARAAVNQFEKHFENAAKRLYVFEDLNKPGQRYAIDLFAFDTPHGLKFHILDIISHGWKRGFDVSNVDFWCAQIRMNAIRRAWGLAVIRNTMAFRIQRAWRKAWEDPKYALCRKRLMNECDELKKAHM